MKPKNRGRPVQIRDFVCTECGTKATATKWKGKTVKGHAKEMWCYRCGKTTRHVQVSER